MTKEWIADDGARRLAKLVVALSTAEHQGDIFEVATEYLVYSNLITDDEVWEFEDLGEVADFLELHYDLED